MNDQERLLTIFLRLQSGAHLSKLQLADEFGVSEKTIQRDFSLLGHYLESQPIVAAELAYDAKYHTRYLKGKSLFNKKDILVISKILLENRSLNKDENKSLIDSLLALISKEEQKEVYQIIASELLNYASLSDTQNRIDKIWEWSEMIRKELVLNIRYQSPYNNEKQHTILPVSLYYDVHYFYVVAFNLTFESYMTLKLDRILDWKVSNEKKPQISYGKRFRDGEVRNKRVDPFMGRDLTIRVQFAYDPTIVTDQFPTARIIEHTPDGAVIEFISQDTPGLKRWLLSQADALTVLSPQSLVNDMKNFLKRMQQNYDK
ncbi:helix-turn-helix transcriptional regulator [Streptococcus suis]|uniref:helix-turn-helix transcriptional regulator n=1 Tax=Streptococcus suis TaxID=1307 RepID=UPI000CF5C550|nr:WYL domain-containing protein [Streptococcus suis]MDW8682688.1 WYL domain-containing protein [Streptococcus suis]NQI72413.1 WYL domain-containing protein [Streptococcus suis]NRG97700.1 WYL domain-containing protein [Streptococcus suis]HEM6219975.1 WYL domain-containing protein [Streptococcus suis]